MPLNFLSDAARKVESQLVWLAIAFAAGFLLGIAGHASPPARVLIAPTPAAIAKPTPTPPPVAAAASTHAHIVITRHFPVPCAPVAKTSDGHSAQPTPTASDDGSETIEIDLGSSAQATAPVPVAPTPAPVPVPVEIVPTPSPHPIGLLVGAGTYPGILSVGIEPWRSPSFGHLDVAPAIILNTKMAGVAGDLGLTDFGDHLYLTVGEAVPFSLPPFPQPFIGCGVRF